MSPRKSESGRVPRDRAADFEKAAGVRPRYCLRLFIAGTTPRSTRAVRNLRKLLAEHLGDDYDLEIVDVYQQPDGLRAEGIIALPTLVKELPLPIRKFIGDLSDIRRVLVGLDIVDRGKGPRRP